MKITFYIRDPREGNYSLEKIFNDIGEILSKDHEVKYFFVDSSKSKMWNIRAAAKCQGDINHITGDVNWIAYGLQKKKTLLTVHDLGHYTNTLTGIRKLIYGELWWKWALQKVNKISAISDFTKDQLIKCFNISSEKISVIYNPLSKEFVRSELNFNKSKPGILQVGSMRNKNVDNLVEAVKDIPCKLFLLRLKNKQLSNRLKDLNIDHKFYTGLSNNEVADLYKSADILYFASTYEGFGLPIIEAQATGKPVITSDMPPMNEVAQEAACYVNPFNVEDIKSGIKRLINDDTYREKLVKTGLDNVKRFDINLISEQYIRLYETIIND